MNWMNLERSEVTDVKTGEEIKLVAPKGQQIEKKVPKEGIISLLSRSLSRALSTNASNFHCFSSLGHS